MFFCEFIIKLFSLYILSGIFAGLFFVFLSYYFGIPGIGVKLFGNPETYAVGASGAIFSLLGLLAVLTPYNKVYFIAGPFIALIVETIVENIYPNPVFLNVFDTLVSIYFFIAIFSMFSFNPKFTKIAIPVKMSFWLLPFVAIGPLVLIGLFITLPIGNSAHFGGLIIGVVYAFILKRKFRRKTELNKKYFCK